MPIWLLLITCVCYGGMAYALINQGFGHYGMAIAFVGWVIGNLGIIISLYGI